MVYEKKINTGDNVHLFDNSKEESRVFIYRRVASFAMRN